MDKKTWRETKVLLRKNWLILRRSWLFMLMFIALPILLMSGFWYLESCIDSWLVEENNNFNLAKYSKINYRGPAFLGSGMDRRQKSLVKMDGHLSTMGGCRFVGRRDIGLIAPSNLTAGYGEQMQQEMSKQSAHRFNLSLSAKRAQMSLHIFDNAEDLFYDISKNQSRLYCFAFEMTDIRPGVGEINVTLFFPRDDIRGLINTYTPLYDLTMGKPDWLSYNTTFLYGTPHFMIYLTDALVTLLRGRRTNELELAFIPMKTAEYLERTPLAAGNLSQVFPLFFLCVYMLPLYYTVSRLAEEKESRTREGMKMMGLSDRSYYISWFLSITLMSALISCLNIAVLQVEVFRQSSVFLMLTMCCLYGTQLFGFSFAIVALFSSKKASATAASILHMSTFYVIFMWRGYGSSLLEKSLIATLVPNCSLGFMLEHLLHCEIEGGIALNMATAMMPYQSFNFMLGLLCQVGCSGLWALLGLYLDKVMPREFGKAEPFHFLCKSKQQKATSVQFEEELHDPELVKLGNFEVDTEYLRRSESIRIRNLRKVYQNGFTAVKSENLTLYSGQIFALLGHNGAGKTTTINMLTGLSEPTEGTAIFKGQDIFTDMSTLRENLGVCPQHNVLFDTLTVREHLEIFCNLKGDHEELEMLKRVDRMVQQIELDDFQFQLANTLSGGQKRKLSVGIALIGDAKVIMLDEPTSGMDTTTRRRFWDMIKQYKQDRIIILTTHYMDEADVLGDRICIMAEGKVQCCGSPLFLKNRFGVGYNLKLIKSGHASSVDSYMRQRLPEAKKLQDVQSEMIWQLPESSRSKFKVFFDELDSDLTTLQLKGYGVSITTLEEVFLKIGHGEGENHTIEQIKQKTADLSKLTARERELVEYSIAHENHKSFKAEMWALMLKKLLVQARDVRSCLMDIVFPSLMIFVGVYVAQLEIIPEGHPTRSLSLYDFPQNIPLVHNTKSNYSAPDEVENFYEFGFGADIGDDRLWSTEVSLHVHSENTSFFEQIEVIDNYLFETRNEAGPYFAESFVQQASRDEHKYSLVSLVNATQPSVILAAASYMLQGVMRTELENPDFRLNFFEAQLPFGIEWQVYINTGIGLLSCFGFAIAYMMISDTLVQSLIKEKQLAIKHQIIISGGSRLTYWLSHFLIDVATHAVPALVAVISIWVFKIDAEGSELLFAWFCITNPIFIYALQFCFKNDSQASVFVRIFSFMFGSVAPIAMQVLQVINRETVQIADYLRAYFKYVPLYNLNFGYISITNRSIVEAFAKLPKNSLKPLDWECAGENLQMIQKICLVSFILTTLVENNVIKVGLMPMLKPIIVHLEMLHESTQRKKPRKPYNLKKLAQMDTDEWHTAEKVHVERIEDEDPLAEQRRIQSLESNIALKVDSLTKSYTPFTKAVDNLSFALDYGECFALLGITGAGKTTTFKCLCQEEIPDQGVLYMAGHDVRSQLGFANARQKVGYCPQFDAIYDNLTVQEHLQFYAAIKGVHPNLQTDLISHQIKELDLRQYTNCRAGQLSGGNKRKLSVAIALLGNPPLLLLDEPSTGVDPQAKRFMWTVISNISTLRKQSTVVLTTHSMEEAEALCPKMGIMVDGRFQCFGSAQHIKDKYADGFDLGLKIQDLSAGETREHSDKVALSGNGLVRETDVQAILEACGFKNVDATQLKKQLRLEPPFQLGDVLRWAHCEHYGLQLIDSLTATFGQCTVVDHQASFYNLKIAKNHHSIGFVFGWMEEHKKHFRIKEYSATQTTLEQIFNMFAKQKGVKDRHESLEVGRAKKQQ